jgi:hypothetical protein
MGQVFLRNAVTVNGKLGQDRECTVNKVGKFEGFNFIADDNFYHFAGLMNFSA